MLIHNVQIMYTYIILLSAEPIGHQESNWGNHAHHLCKHHRAPAINGFPYSRPGLVLMRLKVQQPAGHEDEGGSSLDTRSQVFFFFFDGKG